VPLIIVVFWIISEIGIGCQILAGIRAPYRRSWLHIDKAWFDKPVLSKVKGLTMTGILRDCSHSLQCT